MAKTHVASGTVGTTADTVTLTKPYRMVRVTNRSAAADTTKVLWVSVNGETPTAEGDNVYVVLPQQTITIPVPGVLVDVVAGAGATQTVVKVIGGAASTLYTIAGT